MRCWGKKDETHSICSKQ